MIYIGDIYRANPVIKTSKTLKITATRAFAAFNM